MNIYKRWRMNLVSLFITKIVLITPGADPGFWSGGPSRVLTPRGGGTWAQNLLKIGVFPWNCLKTAWFWKHLGGKGGPGPLDPPLYSLRNKKEHENKSIENLWQKYFKWTKANGHNWESCAIFWRTSNERTYGPQDESSLQDPVC